MPSFAPAVLLKLAFGSTFSEWAEPFSIAYLGAEVADHDQIGVGFPASYGFPNLHMPKPIDLTKLTPQQLKSLLANNEKRGQTATVHAVLEEMTRRGIAKHHEYRSLAWNQDRVRSVMQPFKQVASGVPGNKRQAYTEAGGSKIGRPKDDPERMWIDTYSAIKTPQINAAFVCYIKRPGAEPEFHQLIDGACVRIYNADHLTSALHEWKLIAARAVPAASHHLRRQ